MNRAGVLSCACLLALACGPQQGATRPPTGGNAAPDGGYGAACLAPPKDSDGDGISDHDEGADESPPRDTDGDGTPDYLDSDSRRRRHPRRRRGRNANPCMAPVDSDSDGKPDYIDLDSDDAKDATVGDREEAGPDPTNPVDTDGDGLPDYLDPDNDGDGIPDLVELTAQGGVVAALKLADAPDTDGDGIPDFLDTDSDGDGIPDVVDGIVDTDGDLMPNYRDLDSDGDCIPDAIEGSVDTDGDGIADFVDVDSDNDGLIDGKEDKNCNGMVDACETDRKKADTDGDGVSDLVEVADCQAKPPAQQAVCMCNASDPTTSPLTQGDFVFVVDYNMPPTPTSETLNLSTDVSEADVVFSIDTTGSMGNAITNLPYQPGVGGGGGADEGQERGHGRGRLQGLRRSATSSSTTIATPPSGHGAWPGRRAGRAQRAQRPRAAATLPEAGWEALYSIAGGPALNVNGWVSTFNLGDDDAQPAAGRRDSGHRRWRRLPHRLGADHRHRQRRRVARRPWHGGERRERAQRLRLGRERRAHARHRHRPRAVAERARHGHRRPRLGRHRQCQGAHARHRHHHRRRRHACRLRPGRYAPGDVRDHPVLHRRLGRRRGARCQRQLSARLLVRRRQRQRRRCRRHRRHRRAGQRAQVRHPRRGPRRRSDDRRQLHAQAGAEPDRRRAGGDVHLDGTPPPLQDNFTGPKAAPGGDGVLDTFPGIGGGQQICFDVIPKMNTVVMDTDQPQIFHAILQVKGVSERRHRQPGHPARRLLPRPADDQERSDPVNPAC